MIKRGYSFVFKIKPLKIHWTYFCQLKRQHINFGLNYMLRNINVKYIHIYLPRTLNFKMEICISTVCYSETSGLLEEGDSDYACHTL